MIYNNSRLPASLLREPPLPSQRSAQIAANTKTGTARKSLEPIPPPLKIQVFEVLRQNGFAFNEALELAADVINRFNASPRQRVFAFGPVSFEITAALRTRLISAPVGYETVDRLLERIEAQRNLEIDRREREIRARRERDERRRPW